MSLAEAGTWVLRAKCHNKGDALFPEKDQQRRALAFCAGCPVRSECLAEALDNRIKWGVWGGMTERERRALLRARPDIDSWYDVLVRQQHPAKPLTEVAVLR